MFENDGSNALKPNDYAITLPEQTAQEAARRRRRQAAKPRQRQMSSQQKSAVVAVTIALFAMALTVLMFKAELNTNYKELSQSKDKLAVLSSRVEQLSSEIEGGGSLVAVEEKAAELGLSQAEQSQIVYITLGGKDSGEILAEDGGTRGLSQFFNKVAAIAEYLY